MSGDSIQATGVVEEEFRLPGDTVEVEVSPYDVSRGRITYRGVRRGG